jgi:hypothetical protein
VAERGLESRHPESQEDSGRGEGLEMGRVSALGLWIAAAFVTSALLAASASAELPEYRVCAKASPKNTGEYTSKTCATKVGTPKSGGYEVEAWTAAKKKTFKGKGGEARFTSYIKGMGIVASVACKSTKDSGEITGSTTSSLKLELAGCMGDGGTCTTKGDKKTGQIILGLEGRLGFIQKEPVRIGHNYSVSVPGSIVTCVGQPEVTIEGSMIGEITGDVNEASGNETLTFAVNAGGEQDVVSFEGEAEEHVLISELMGVGAFPTGFVGSLYQKKVNSWPSSDH